MVLYSYGTRAGDGLQDKDDPAGLFPNPLLLLNAKHFLLVGSSIIQGPRARLTSSHFSINFRSKMFFGWVIAQNFWNHLESEELHIWDKLIFVFSQNFVELL